MCQWNQEGVKKKKTTTKKITRTFIDSGRALPQGPSASNQAGNSTIDDEPENCVEAEEKNGGEMEEERRVHLQELGAPPPRVVKGMSGTAVTLTASSAQFTWNLGPMAVNIISENYSFRAAGRGYGEVAN
ncbi:hypothetical protein L6164_033722 [Bauhinia variegata]|uniref:Uncharacterized protein n=1 Tax=Bauhinia variegata TaxID=167791 RepID=A0ACB9KST7_BAUVA|nr:hypothetical protein L6164_033722 [Bauhinia variegata]